MFIKNTAVFLFSNKLYYTLTTVSVKYKAIRSGRTVKKEKKTNKHTSQHQFKQYNTQTFTCTRFVSSALNLAVK